jgi:hypothetical protein
MKKIKIDMQITELCLPIDSNFIAMDKDGKWMWYVNRPHIGFGIWMPNIEEEEFFDESTHCICRSRVLSNEEWKDSLIEL